MIRSIFSLSILFSFHVLSQQSKASTPQECSHEESASGCRNLIDQWKKADDPETRKSIETQLIECVKQKSERMRQDMEQMTKYFEELRQMLKKAESSN